MRSREITDRYVSRSSSPPPIKTTQARVSVRISAHVVRTGGGDDDDASSPHRPTRPDAVADRDARARQGNACAGSSRLAHSGPATRSLLAARLSPVRSPAEGAGRSPSRVSSTSSPRGLVRGRARRPPLSPAYPYAAVHAFSVFSAGDLTVTAIVTWPYAHRVQPVHKISAEHTSRSNGAEEQVDSDQCTNRGASRRQVEHEPMLHKPTLCANSELQKNDAN